MESLVGSQVSQLTCPLETSGSGLRGLDFVSMNLTVRTFDRIFQNLLYVLYASDRKAGAFLDRPLLYKIPPPAPDPHSGQEVKGRLPCHVVEP